jgi:cell division initiation protein
MAELSPLDILGKSFSRRLNGCDPQEVQNFLAQVASELESTLKERGELKLKVHRMEVELAEFRERESALHEALVAAQRSAETTLEGARKEGQKIVEEGHTLADRLVDEANQRAKTIEVVIGELRAKRREVRAELLRFVEILQGVIDDDHRAEKEERTTAQLALLNRTSARSRS